MHKHYNSRSYANDKAFVEAVDSKDWPSLLMPLSISAELHRERVGLLRQKGVKSLICGEGQRVSLDKLEKSGSEKAGFRVGKAFRNIYDQSSSDIAEYEAGMAKDASQGYEAVVEQICSGNGNEGGLVATLMKRDELARSIAEADEAPLLHDGVSLRREAEALDQRIRQAVESCPEDALPALRQRAGYLLGKFYSP